MLTSKKKTSRVSCVLESLFGVYRPKVVTDHSGKRYQSQIAVPKSHKNNISKRSSNSPITYSYHFFKQRSCHMPGPRAQVHKR